MYNDMVYKTEDGFYQLLNKPTPIELNDYYSQKYYQDDKATYKKSYSGEELKYIYNKIEQKHLLFSNFFRHTSGLKLLDVGCGEGFCLSYFHKNGWYVKGLDYSDFGLEIHNPEMKPFIETGDIYANIEKLISTKVKFDLLWLDNVLEHVLDPFQLLKFCSALTSPNGILVVEVPNDFSPIQIELKKKELIKNDFWVIVPDHISYFNKTGLINIAKRAGWEERVCIADFPIDFNLFNADANYVINRSRGKNAHLQRVQIENLLHEISPTKTNLLYKLFADLGLGRQIIAIFQKNI